MANASGMALKITALTSVGLGGWFAGQLFEKWKHVRENRDSQTSLLSQISIKNMPGLPIFGTVSAATPLTPSDNKIETGSPALSATASRVSQVCRVIAFTNSLT